VENEKKGCEDLVEFLCQERKDLVKEIEKDKWYLSEKAGYDVGYEFAKKHFLSNVFYVNAWADLNTGVLL